MSDIHAIPASCVQSKAPKSTITKKSGKTKKGLGAKKVSKIDFEALEKDAEENAKLETQTLTSNSKPSLNSAPKSLEVAYQSLSIQEKKNESKLNELSDKKKQQAERLGMGFGKTKGNDVNHSLDMVTIEQNNPKKKNSRRKNRYDYSDDDDDDMKYYDASSSVSKQYRGRIDGDWVVVDSAATAKSKQSLINNVIEPIVPNHQADSNLFRKPSTSARGDEKKISGRSTLSQQQKPISNLTEANSYDRNSKAISSDQLFSRSHHQDQPHVSNVRMEGRSGISSDDYYGRSTSGSASRNMSRNMQQHVPDLYDIKEGVKQGVRSVAGKLSSVVGAINEAIEERRYN